MSYIRNPIFNAYNTAYKLIPPSTKKFCPVINLSGIGAKQNGESGAVSRFSDGLHWGSQSVLNVLFYFGDRFLNPGGVDDTRCQVVNRDPFVGYLQGNVPDNIFHR